MIFIWTVRSASSGQGCWGSDGPIEDLRRQDQRVVEKLIEEAGLCLTLRLRFVRH